MQNLVKIAQKLVKLVHAINSSILVVRLLDPINVNA
jgi:hypothetical protein